MIKGELPTATGAKAGQPAHQRWVVSACHGDFHHFLRELPGWQLPGLANRVNGKAGYLHDGRARSVDESRLLAWGRSREHEGESPGVGAQGSADPAGLTPGVVVMACGGVGISRSGLASALLYNSLQSLFENQSL